MKKSVSKGSFLLAERLGLIPITSMLNKKTKVYRIAPRQVNCLLCRKRMFYSGDPRWEPEFSLVIELNHKVVESHYVHQICWNDFPKMVDQIKMSKKCGPKRKSK